MYYSLNIRVVGILTSYKAHTTRLQSAPSRLSIGYDELTTNAVKFLETKLGSKSNS